MKNVLFAIVLFAASCACAANPVVQSASAAEAAGSRVDPEGTFTLPGSKGRLSALLKLPDDMRPGDRCPIAVLCHGFGADKCAQGGMFCDFAVALARVGVASVRFDFNGHGESEGALRDMTVLNEIEDAKRVVEWAASRPWCNGKVSLLGHSQGGVVAAMAAGELGAEKIARVVLLAPACVLKDDVRRGCTFGSRYDPKNPPEFVRLPGGKEIGRAFIQTSYDLPIFETARKFTENRRSPVKSENTKARLTMSFWIRRSVSRKSMSSTRETSVSATKPLDVTICSISHLRCFRLRRSARKCTHNANCRPNRRQRQSSHRTRSPRCPCRRCRRSSRWFRSG